MNKFLKITGLVVILITVLRFYSFYTAKDTIPSTNDSTFYENFQKDYAIYSLPLPEKLSFAGEKVPISDPQIKESFDRELLVNTYWQSHSILYIKRAARYFPVIEPILKEYGIPEDFKYLPLIESGFKHVISPAGAVGFWQILEDTGEEYGLEINKEVDERYHVEKATRAACKYLRDAYEELGSWTLAAASYNRGISGVKSQIERQKADNFYDLTLNPETFRYLYRIMAVREILQDPQKYGFHVREKDKYKPIPTFTVEIDTAIDHFGSLYEKYDINYRILKFHNPWLRYEYLPNRPDKTYKIKIPKKGHYEIVRRRDVTPSKMKEGKVEESPISDQAK